MQEVMHSDLIQANSEQRFERYTRACYGDSSKALALYQLNAQMSASFWIDLMWLEVTLRNSIDKQLKLFFSENWYRDIGFLQHLEPLHQKMLAQAVESLTKPPLHSNDGLSGKVISDLTFEFWVGLLSKSYTHSLWVPSLRKIFNSTLGANRGAVHQKLEAIRRLRNRIAHHEPIFHLNLLDLNDVMNDLLKSLNLAVADLVRNNSQTKLKLMQLT